MRKLRQLVSPARKIAANQFELPLDIEFKLGNLAEIDEPIGLEIEAPSLPSRPSHVFGAGYEVTVITHDDRALV